MSYVGIPSVPRDSTIASSMIVQDYIAKHFRGESAISKRYKPTGVDSCFGNFPAQYKRKDHWDGNPTLRRDSRTAYTSPKRSPPKSRRPRGADIPEVSGTIKGVTSRPTSGDACRRSSDRASVYGAGREGRDGGVNGGQGTGAKSGGEGTISTRTVPRPKTASAVRGPPSLLSVRGAAVNGTDDGRRYIWNRGGEGEGSSEGKTNSTRSRPRPQTAGAVSSTTSQRRLAATNDLPDKEELEATRKYLLTHGKFRVTPSKLMTSLQVARATNSRPLSAPACVRRRRPPAPPKAGAWRRRPIAATRFRKYYVRGDLPICVAHHANGNAIRWKIRPADLDFHVYLPIFFDGLREVEDPYRFLATQGTLDMIEAAPDKVLPVIPQLIIPVKTALNTREPRIMCPTLKILQQMILLSPMAGQAMVPYYRQLLPVFNLFRGKNQNMGDAIDYNQRSRTNVGELIMETLEVMEQFGGPDAFINIKYMVPTYESCGP